MTAPRLFPTAVVLLMLGGAVVYPIAGGWRRCAINLCGAVINWCIAW